MTTSILNEVLLLKDKPLKAMVDYLHSINLDIFNSLTDSMVGDVYEVDNIASVECKQTILYILCAFSEDSPMIILRQDDKTEKEAICEYLEIPELYRPGLINLVAPGVRSAVTTYVSQFAGPLFRNLCFLKIQLNDFQLNLTNFNYGSFEEVESKDGSEPKKTYHYDIKEHGKANIETIRLSKEIDKLEREIKSQVKRMDGIEELKAFKHKSTNKTGGARSGNVENSKFIS